MRLCQAGDRSVAEVAKDLDLTETALGEWLKRAEEAAEPAPAEALSAAETFRDALL